MVKFNDLFCNKSLGRSARRYLAPFRRYFDILLTSVFISTTLDGVTSFFLMSTTEEMHVNVSVIVKTVSGISLFDGGKKKDKRKVQGVPQSQAAALPRYQEEEETDKSKQA